MCGALLRAGEPRPPPASRCEHTTIGVVATNATLTKAQATKVAQMAHDGLARAIVPAHTSSDGDTIFALATGTRTGEPPTSTRIGALAAEVMAQAIVRAVRAAARYSRLPRCPRPAVSVTLLAAPRLLGR